MKQTIFESTGDEVPSSGETRIRTQVSVKSILQQTVRSKNDLVIAEIFRGCICMYTIIKKFELADYSKH